MLNEQESFIYPKKFPEAIMERDLPCWYELSWQEESSSLILKINKDFIQNTQLVSPNHPLIDQLRKKFDLPPFGNNFSEDIGFGDFIKNIGKDDKGFMNFLISIPRILSGSSTDRYPAYVLSANLTALLFQLRKPCDGINSPLPQLFVLETTTDNKKKSGLLVIVSLSLANLLRKKKMGSEIVETMKKAHKKMFGEGKSFIENAFVMEQRENGIILFGSKQRWSMSLHYTTYSDADRGRGYRLEGDNLDNPMQQIILITGLAALHDCARREIK